MKRVPLRVWLVVNEVGGMLGAYSTRSQAKRELLMWGDHGVCSVVGPYLLGVQP